MRQHALLSYKGHNDSRDGVHVSGVYAVLGRRRARVVREEMREGSDLFSIHAYLPAQASFGFANDMRRQSSGVYNGKIVH